MVFRVDERLAVGITITHRGNRRHLGDQSIGRDHAMLLVVDIHVVVVERGECADDTDHDRHRMGVTPEATEETYHRLV